MRMRWRETLTAGGDIVRSRYVGWNSALGREWICRSQRPRIFVVREGVVRAVCRHDRVSAVERAVAPMGAPEGKLTPPVFARSCTILCVFWGDCSAFARNYIQRTDPWLLCGQKVFMSGTPRYARTSSLETFLATIERAPDSQPKGVSWTLADAGARRLTLRRWGTRGGRADSRWDRIGFGRRRMQRTLRTRRGSVIFHSCCRSEIA